ncbi:response regulator [Algoriphagus aquimarinus]|uniref:Response regulator receiver domain-containing protein n=1 Tax=Algoriphagus aquimarinus TaxID=237018 RepID=A0A1I1APX0_9BACT|nr:response regulator [Algoriphagus aquimarinus]SFB38528.1 Response regulator receiver domain-containing protein [Algoriphagus aquimarinus]|tara:strand:+ start:193589 stop:194005 length:417 start_codon:yes stop_codon:yes gene_type:complete
MKIKLLIIDDDKVSLLIAEKFLIVSGIKKIVQEILIFNKPIDALKLLFAAEDNDEMCQLWILLDINMPKISGWDFLNRVESVDLKKDVKVIMLTSSISEEDKNRAASYNSVYGYISKPLDMDKCNEIKQIILNSENGI